MRVPLIVIAGLLIVPQGWMAGSQSPSVLVAPPVGSACPVRFHVDRKGSFGLEAASGAEAKKGTGLDLSFRSEKKIVEARITIHGMDKGVHMVPSAGTMRAPDATEIFDLKGTAERPLTNLPVWMERLGMVSWAELTRVVYSDGTEWKPAGEQRCTATPSLMVLVDGAAR